jgi:hypothetical protein
LDIFAPLKYSAYGFNIFGYRGFNLFLLFAGKQRLINKFAQIPIFNLHASEKNRIEEKE